MQVSFTDADDSIAASSWGQKKKSTWVIYPSNVSKLRDFSSHSLDLAIRHGIKREYPNKKRKEKKRKEKEWWSWKRDKESCSLINIGVHSNSNAAERRSGANAFGPSGAVSASAGNCGRGRTRCQGKLCFFTRTLPMAPSRVGGPTATLQWYIPGQNCFISSAPWWWDWGTTEVDANTVPGWYAKDAKTKSEWKPHRLPHSWTQKKSLHNLKIAPLWWPLL